MKKNIPFLILLISFSTSIHSQVTNSITYNETKISLKEKIPFNLDFKKSDISSTKDKTLMGDFEFDIKNTAIKGHKTTYTNRFI